MMPTDRLPPARDGMHPHTPRGVRGPSRVHLGGAAFIAVLFVAVMVSFPTWAGAQSAYRTAPGDTLVYGEQSDQLIRILAPDGATEGRHHREASIEVTFPAPERARATYLALAMELTSGEGIRAPDTGPVLGLPFVLAFSALGLEETLEAPELPPEFEDLPDLARQFDDFFLPLPGRELSVGVQWTDTATFASTGDREELRRMTVRELEVVGDTVVDGVAAWRIDASARIENSVRSHVEELSADAVSTLSGVESGWFLFSKEGVMLARERRGELSGRLTYILADGELPFEQTHSYTTTIALTRR